ncbi:hypothetical protein HS088_TW14G00699 [Tripterygium wilfordii]|uniref:RING-type domain-containing protein n=1 Tax=Tripterygium wilfordii TaxID=458696 RepID=A0A7J7CR15_TRIWF|nr:hypothetical protein HS088_TW14G00699 [Tripterygium wilfordii]
METTQDSQTYHWHYTELDHNFTIHGRTLFFVLALFCIVIIVTVLFLYARWVFRFHDNQILQPTSSRAWATRVLQGLDPATINSLPIKQHKYSTTVENSECCICLGLFEDGEKVKVLPQCYHCYHCECVDKWLSAHSSCPLCRASLNRNGIRLDGVKCHLDTCSLPVR